MAAARRRTRTVLIVLGVLVVVVVACVVADVVAKQYATGAVRSGISEALGIDASTPVTVDLGPGSILLQAARGSIDSVTVNAEAISLGELSGSVAVTATGVPLDSGKPVSTLRILVTISQADVAKFAAYLSGITVTKIELTEGIIRASADVKVLIAAVPLSVDLVPSARNGAIAFSPKTIRLGGTQLSVADLRANPLLSSIAGDILRSRDVCVASSLPKALAVDRVAVVGSQLQILISGDGAVLGDPAMSTLGTCP